MLYFPSFTSHFLHSCVRYAANQLPVKQTKREEERSLETRPVASRTIDFLSSGSLCAASFFRHAINIKYLKLFNQGSGVAYVFPPFITFDHPVARTAPLHRCTTLLCPRCFFMPFLFWSSRPRRDESLCLSPTHGFFSFGGFEGSLKHVHVWQKTGAALTFLTALLPRWYHCERGRVMQTQEPTKHAKSLKNTSNIWSTFTFSAHLCSIPVRDQCVPVFAFMLFCVPEHVAPPPFRRFIPEAVVQYQNYHINQSTNVWAADLMHLVLSLPVCLSLCFQHLSFNASPGPFFFFFPTIPSCFKNGLEQKWTMCRFQKPKDTVGLTVASKSTPKLILKPKITQRTEKRSFLLVKWIKKWLWSPNLFGLHTNLIPSTWPCRIKNLSLYVTYKPSFVCNVFSLYLNFLRTL